MKQERCGLAVRGFALSRVAALAIVALLPATDAAAWWNTQWSHRRKLLLDSNEAGALASVPVLVVLTPARIDYSKTKAGGADLRFVDSNDGGAILDHQIERWSPGGTSYVWVRVPQVDGGSTTDFIWMYYGNPTVADGQNPGGVWSAGYNMVLHLNETAGQHLDSATADGASNNSSTVSVVEQGSATTPIIDGSDRFVAASSQYVQVPDHASLDAGAGESLTVEAWVRPASLSGWQHVVSKEPDGSGTEGGFELSVVAGTVRWSVGNTVPDPDEECVANSTTTLVAATWYHIAGRYDRASGDCTVFVDGLNEGSSSNGSVGTLANGQPLGIARESDGTPDYYFDGRVDEVRLSKGARSDAWMRAQHRSMRDAGFVTFGPEAAQCCGLVVTELAADPDAGFAQTIKVNGPNRFDIRFNAATGGGIDRFVDAEENTGFDLAGGGDLQRALFTHEISDGVENRTTGDTGDGVKLDVLEATPVRAKVRQEAAYAHATASPVVQPGLKGFGDYSVYGVGRLAIGWEARATADVTASYSQVQVTVPHAAFAPFDAWAGYSSSFGPVASPFAGQRGPALDPFLLAQSEVPNARTDFLTIAARDWTNADNTFFGQWNPGAWEEVSWIDDNSYTFLSGTSTRWWFLTYFKPTNMADNSDLLVQGRSNDYRSPDVLVINAGKGSAWQDPGENTAVGDWFNEGEAAYLLDFDPLQGLDFDLDGSDPMDRYRPFFKIRQWRSFIENPTVTVEGQPLVNGRDFRAAVKPFARAHFEKDLTWYSTLDGTSHVTSPQVGTGGTIQGGADFPGIPPYRHGYNARFVSDGQYLLVPTAGNLDPAEGSIEFWYLPFYDYGSGGSDPDDYGLFGYWIDASNYFYAYFDPVPGDGPGPDEGLTFAVSTTAGGLAKVVTGAGAGFTDHWRANQWVHLRFVWKADAVPAQSRLEIYIDGKFVPPSAASVGSYTVPVGTEANFAIGDRGRNDVFDNNAFGRIDEFRVYSAAEGVTGLAHGGLSSDSAEHLATSASDFTFTFAAEDPNHRGEYLYVGADSKFRGVNVDLEVPGVGSGLDLEWFYWDGFTWLDLELTPGFTDQTSHLTRNGTIYWTSDPTNWAPYSLRGGPDLYYVMARLKSGSYSGQFPRENVIKTDILLFQHCHDVVAQDQTFVFGIPWPTTAVKLMSFTAVPGDGTVTLEWRTGSELDNLGFHVYRGPSAEGPWARATSALIPGLGSSPIGQSYSWTDTGLANGVTYYYRLEDVDTASVSTFHGPVSATPVAASASPPPEGGGGEPGGGSGGGGGTGPTSATCPSWVVAALGTSSSGPVECTRHGDPEAVSLEVLSRDGRGATLELRTGGFWAVREPSGTVRVLVPGFDTPADASAPALPLRRAFVEAVVGKKVRLVAAEALDLRGFRGLRPSSMGTPEMAVSRDGTVRPGRRAVAAPRLSRGYLPQHVARLGGTVFQGETKSAVVEMTPVRFDGYRQQLVLASRVRVRLAFTGRQSEETGTGSAGRMAPRKATPFRDVLARLHTSGRGLHAVSFEELFPSRQRGLAAGQLRLQRQGRAVAFRVEPATGVFGPGSTLLFFADQTASSTDYSSEVAWELVRSASGQGMGVVLGAPEGGALASSPLAYASFETNRIYQPGLLEAPDVWLWEGMVGGNPARTVSLGLFGIDRTSSEPAQVLVFLQGGSESGTAEEHHVEVSLNGAVVGEGRFAGKKAYRLSLSVAASLLVEGANGLSLRNVGDAGVSSLVFLDRVSVSYPQAATARGGAFEGAWTEGGTVEVGGVSASPAVLDLDGAAVRWVTGFEAGPGSVRFRAEAGRRYVVVSREGLLTPRVERPVPSTLRDGANQADYVVIAPREFLEAAQPLLARRESQGLTTMAVAFEEIAEVFGHGQPSAEAIRDFLAFAYHSWSRPSPRYVVLLGDATYDPRRFLTTSWASPLPALWARTSYLWTVSDPALGAVNGTDGVPDLAIGRLPAQTPAEAVALVSKLLAWEDSGQDLSGRAVLVADDADGAGDFEADVADIRASFLGGRPTEVLKVRELGASTRPAIQGAFDDGASLVSYVGHGGAAVWASENVWSSWDAPSLQAQGAQPLLLTLNCLNGYFVAPNFESLSEAMLKAEGRGAIAAFSPSGLSLDGPAHQFHRAVVAEISGGAHERLGDAVLAAQKAYAQSGLMPELLSVYQLLGDPAMRLR
jgi:hypothetical protein